MTTFDLSDIDAAADRRPARALMDRIVDTLDDATVAKLAYACGVDRGCQPRRFFTDIATWLDQLHDLSGTVTAAKVRTWAAKQTPDRLPTP